jgi:hypothetical protein
MLDFIAGATFGIVCSIVMWALLEIKKQKIFAVTHFRSELKPIYNYIEGKVQLGAALDDYDKMVIQRIKKEEALWTTGLLSDGSAPPYSAPRS